MIVVHLTGYYKFLPGLSIDFFKELRQNVPMIESCEWSSDEELFSLILGALHTPVVGDVLDALGQYHRFLPRGIRQMSEDMTLVGRAMPVRFGDVDGPQSKPFGLLTEALDDLRPGEIFLAAGGGRRSAYWGELLTATARVRGARGAVVDGYHRDTPLVLAQGWPVFSRGAYGRDSAVRSAVTDFRCPMEIEGVWVEPGDLLFGDMDGVVVIPADLEVEVISRALEKMRGEKIVRQAIEQGMSSTEAFRTYGIL